MRGLRVVGRTAGSGKANMPENSRSCGKEMWSVDEQLRAALRDLIVKWREIERELALPVEGIPRHIRQREAGRIGSLLSELEALLASEKLPADVGGPAEPFMTLSEGIEQGRQEGYAQGYECGKRDAAPPAKESAK